MKMIDFTVQTLWEQLFTFLVFWCNTAVSQIEMEMEFWKENFVQLVLNL